MQSEEFDKKIIEAAEHHRPVYTEKSWVAMRSLLDEHLPEKSNDRRRLAFLLLLLLGLGAGVWLIAGKAGNKQPLAENTAAGGSNADKNKQSNTVQPATGNSSAVSPGGNTPTAGTDGIPADGKNAVTGINGERTVSPTTTAQQNLPAGNINNISTKTSATTKTTISRNQDGVPGTTMTVTNGGGNKQTKAKTNNNNTVQPGNAVETLAKATDKNRTTEPVVVINDPVLPADPKNNTQPVTDVVKNNDPVNATADNKATTSTDTKVNEKEVAKKVSKDKTRSPLKKSLNLAFSFSAGPDISMVGMNQPGKVQPVYGAGVSLSYGKHFSISTGYYSVRKVYKAEAADYKFPTRPYHYSYLYEIDGNCKVIEIPITVSWNFAAKKRGNWFVSAGASSFLMRRETYDYLYKYPTGQVTSYTKQFGNKNQHILSVVSLSGGYKYNLSKSVFVAAEPYMKLPTKGVGAGKLNLNSGGVLFTIGVKPFK